MEKTSRETRTEYGDLSRLAAVFFKTLLRFWWFVALVTALLACAYTLYQHSGFRPMYQSTAKFTVTSGYSSSDILANNYYYDNDAAQQLASAFPYILKTDVMREQILRTLNTSTINGSINASSVASTNLFVLQVVSTDAQSAYDIIRAVIDIYPRIASYMVDYSQISIKSEPTLPSEPYNSFNWKSSLLRGAVIGLLFSLGILFVLSLSRKTICSQRDLKERINIPVFSSIPRVVKRRRKSQALLLNISGPGADQDFEEGIRRLRVKLLASAEQDGSKVFLFTSTTPNEGKTTISINAALSLAKAGKKVLLIDADFRKQDAIWMLFGQNMPNLSVQNRMRISTLPNAELYLTQVPESSLKVLLAGENSGFSIPMLGAVLDEMVPQFDFIILDTAPNGIVADTRYISRHADSVVYVIRCDFAPQRQIQDSIQSLAAQNARLIGCVLNGAAAVSHRYGYGGYYGYGNKYGHGYFSQRDR